MAIGLSGLFARGIGSSSAETGLFARGILGGTAVAHDPYVKYRRPLRRLNHERLALLREQDEERKLHRMQKADEAQMAQLLHLMMEMDAAWH
jgi:hypothetical protein